MRLLLVEDDAMLGAGLKTAFEKAHYGVDWFTDGESALLALKTNEYSLIVLDLGLPDMSGLEVLKNVRKQGMILPVLILTAQGRPEQKVQGLDAGADDYLVKPFDLYELLARLRALHRRSNGNPHNILVSGDVSLDRATGEVRIGEATPVLLTAKELKVLTVLLEKAGKFVTKGEIEYILYSDETAVESNTVETAVYTLRKKLSSNFIQTVRGLGYRVAA